MPCRRCCVSSGRKEPCLKTGSDRPDRTHPVPGGRPRRLRFSWQLRLAVALVLLSAALYLLHYGVFHDAHHIFIYLLGDLAFLPIEVLLVTIIVQELLAQRERRALLRKMNMVIGAFFSEVGEDLLARFVRFDQAIEPLRETLRLRPDWTDRDFELARALLAGHEFRIDPRGDLAGLKHLLTGRRAFLLGLLENPNLLEHESFTDLLWAVSHLTDELAHRHDVRHLSAADRAHLAEDVRRAYRRLVGEWLDYLRHLRHRYPYLYSLAVRLNPFDPRARAELP